MRQVDGIFVSDDTPVWRYVCINCGWAFKRVTNAMAPNTLPCTVCSGVMEKYPAETEEVKPRRWWQFWR